ncbi:Transcriptional regulator PadR-like family protein [compost metagenome]
MLHRLERLGYIRAEWGESESGRKRRYYRLTKTGRAALAEQRRQWQLVDGMLRGVWPSSGHRSFAKLVVSMQGI